MRKLGYVISDKAKIAVEKTIEPEKQIKIDGVLLNAGYVLKQQYIEQTYGSEVESMPNANVKPEKPTPEKKR
jgi:NADP-dependent 3-hydroxy acid dehydrogenase YdfG